MADKGDFQAQLVYCEHGFTLCDYNGCLKKKMSFILVDWDAFDPFWRQLSDECDQLLLIGPLTWTFLIGKRFLCWDGNHWNMAWKRATKEAYHMDKHYCEDLPSVVKYVMVHITKKNKLEIEITTNNQNV